MKRLILTAAALVLTASPFAMAKNGAQPLRQSDYMDPKLSVPALDFNCSVVKDSESRTEWINIKNSKISIEGKVQRNPYHTSVYIPTWKKQVTYDAGNGYSVQINILAEKYQQIADSIIDEPMFEVIVSILKDGQVVSKTNTRSEFVVKEYNMVTQTFGNLIELKLGVENLLPGADADGIRETHINCQMPVEWKFTGKSYYL